jgi:predicted RNase H-like nuclease
MAVLVGANGSRGDWLTIRLDSSTGQIAAAITPTELLPSLEFDVLAIDIPIGLADAGERAADRLARKFVGPRRSSVFPSPILPALRCSSRAEASAVTKEIDGRSVAAQAFGLYPKICGVRDLLQRDPHLAQRTLEVHPEVSFAAWASQHLQHHKKTPLGKQERLALIARDFGSEVFQRLQLGSRPRLPDDDVADAFAALWTADRIARGAASHLPAELIVDSTGISMNIWY